MVFLFLALKLIFFLVNTGESFDKISTLCEDSSQFGQLENFIGSIHENAPSKVEIEVFFRNLSDWQLSILSSYENVRTFRVENISSRNVLTNFVSVNEELIDFDTKKFEVRNEKVPIGNLWIWPFVESIRKRTRLAVVIPFIRRQLDSIGEQLNKSVDLKICRTKSKSDLIFYHNENRKSSIEEKIRILIEPFRSSIEKCFENVRILNVDLSDANDSYLFGSAMMWKSLIDLDDEQSLLRRSYTHFFLMEHDTRPIRPFWLDKIHQTISDGRKEDFFATNWWILGSSYRGLKNILTEHAHINGNAVYHLSSNFVEFVRFFWPIYLENLQLGYDYAATFYFSKDLRFSYVWRSIHFRFRYSDFIQNCWHTGCLDDRTRFTRENPQTIFVHGRTFESIEQNRSGLFVFYFLLILLFLVFVKRFAAIRRRLKAIFPRTFFVEPPKVRRLSINYSRG